MTEEEDNWYPPEPIDKRRMIESFFGITTRTVPSRRRTREELISDIHLSFDFAMRDGVFSSDEPMTEKAAKALKDWLLLLHKTLPAGWKLHALLDQLIRDFSYITKHEAYLYRILDQFRPVSSVWSPACSKGDPDAGYTCGLWELFHAMTVGVVDYNVMNHERKRIATGDAANTLRNYIENFFGCVECRNNFLAMYDSCAHDRCTRLQADAKGLVKDKQPVWAQLSLWLFEAHNAVNVRLMKEKAGRENRETTLQDETDVLWPSKRDCLPCYKANNANEVKWNRTNVYKWLLLEYGQRDSNTGNLIKEMQDLTVAMEKKERRKLGRIEVTSGSALVAFFVVFVLGAKVRRRRATGRHKKVESKNEDPSPMTPQHKRGTLTHVRGHVIANRYY
jgi:hypothetical protein